MKKFFNSGPGLKVIKCTVYPAQLNKIYPAHKC